ncbi:MAG: DUF4276 family protein [Clostridia bacterium]|nr:DUF4276 family protein [Clostridia bacterium]
MKNVYVLCEGQTEEGFINRVLAPYLLPSGLYVFPIIITTKRTATAKHRGGVSSFSKIRKELQMLSKRHPNEFVTTMFDYYALPGDTPGIENNDVDVYRRIAAIESEIDHDLGFRNCFVNLMLHEFEALLFADPRKFAPHALEREIKEIQRVRDAFDTPEHINCSIHTAPSKRLEAIIPKYAKVIFGTLVAEKIGMSRILAECKHFAGWVEKIKSIA